MGFISDEWVPDHRIRKSSTIPLMPFRLPLLFCLAFAAAAQDPVAPHSAFEPPAAKAAASLAASTKASPPDLLTTVNGTTTSFWGLYWAAYWELTWCQWQKRLDPARKCASSGQQVHDLRRGGIRE